MCRMAHCCFYLPLNVGCVLGSIIEFFLVVAETLIYFNYTHLYEEDERAMALVEMCLILMCSVLLFIGAVKEERICVISHSVFLAMSLFGEVVCELVVLKFAFFQDLPEWIYIYNVLYHMFLLYMIPAAISYSVELKDKHHGEDGSARHHRLMSSVMSAEIYGM